jgi:hypothetical protein
MDARTTGPIQDASSSNRTCLRLDFAYDYGQMRHEFAPIREELLRHVMHPSRWSKDAQNA